jgi:hypothetical protein
MFFIFFFIKFDFLYYIFFIEMTTPNLVDDFIHRLSVDIFDEDIVDNTNPSKTQYYYPQANAPYYPRHMSLPLHSRTGRARPVLIRRGPTPRGQ